MIELQEHSHKPKLEWGEIYLNAVEGGRAALGPGTPVTDAGCDFDLVRRAALDCDTKRMTV